MDAINHALAWLLVTSWAVPAIVGALALGCVLILWVNYARHHRGLQRALGERLSTLAPVRDATDPAEARAAFARDFAMIDAVMADPGDSPALAHAWQDFRDTLVDPAREPIEATSRPEEHFAHLGDETRVLAWWANLFVAFGLTFTFLGIVAALTATTDSLRDAGADTSHMSGALVTLLTLTAAKFWTSIGGVVASIVLRYVDRRWHSASRRRLDRLARALARGTRFLPPQRIAADQLVALDRLPERIGASLSATMGALVERIGGELGEAIGRTAGDGLRQLEGASASAGDRIAEAAQAFSTVSAQMTQAFLLLNGRIEGMAERLTGEGEQAARRAADQVADIGRALAESAQAVADRQAETMARAAAAIEEAARRASAGMGDAIGDAVERSAQAGERVLASAFAGLDRSFEEASAGLTRSLAETTRRIEALAQAIARSADATGDHAARLAATGREAAGVTAGLSRAAQDLGAAADPVREASTGIAAALDDTRDLVRRSAERVEKGEAAMQALAEEMGRTTATSARAWGEYRDRFEDVDEALGGALARLRQAHEDHAATLNAQVARIDGALAQAVDRLARLVERIDARAGRTS